MIELTPYNSKWPQAFATEKVMLESLIGDFVVGGIEHVGSTAIEGMLAKPVIDIMVGVKSLSESKTAIERLTPHYCYYPYKADVMHWFCKPTPDIRTHHLHLIPFDSVLWHERLSFRDYLRENPEVAQEYAQLKLTLATKFQHDREAYTQSKWPFIQKVLASIN